MVTVIFGIAGSFISLYSLLILVRIVLTWFQGPTYLGRPAELLAAVTDPYLNWFRRFGFLRIGSFDLSPVAGLVVLSVLGHIAGSLAGFGRISLGIILALLVDGIWSAASFLLFIFFLLSLIRFIGIMGKLNPASPMWRTIDYVLNPILLQLTRLLMAGKPTSYLNGLIIGGLTFLAGWVLGGILIDQLVRLLTRLPF
jgi:YggT family protein